MEKQITYSCTFNKCELYERFNQTQFDKDRARFKNSVLNSSRINHIFPYFEKKSNKTFIKYINHHMSNFDVKYIVNCENNLITFTKKEEKFSVFQNITKWIAIIGLGILAIVCMVAPNIPWPVPALMLFFCVLLLWLSRCTNKFAKKMIDEYVDIVLGDNDVK